jgi:chemotaxis protein MotB
MTFARTPLSERLTVRRPGRTAFRGAWKLAYADFTTAMMAFFLLMWIVNGTEAETRGEIADYFNAKANAAQTHMAQDDIGARFESAMAELGRTDGISIHRAGDRIRVEFFETPEHPMFALGDAALTRDAIALLGAVAPLITEIGAQVEIEGHTDSQPVSPAAGSNWALAARRAEAAREVLVQSGVPAERIEGITGRGASRPIDADDPASGVNRRISLIFEL